jgi:hypothetical protein
MEEQKTETPPSGPPALHVVDRRTSAADDAPSPTAEPEATAAAAETPAPATTKAKSDRNRQFKPLTVNKEDLDPYALLAAGRGSNGDIRRCVLLARDRLDRVVRAVDANFERMRYILVQLTMRDDALDEWRRRPWYKRWFRKPTLPALQSQPPAAPWPQAAPAPIAVNQVDAETVENAEAPPPGA